MIIIEPTVFVVDDEEVVRDSVRFLLESVHLKVETFSSAEEFLEQYSIYRVGCLLLDIRMAGMSGLQLQQQLNKTRNALPIIIITGHGDVPLAVRAMKDGAIDFIQKPYNDQELLDRVQLALLEDQKRQRQRLHHNTVQARIDNLTKRERQVLDLIVKQVQNKAIATELGISVKTVEFHRSRVMEKMHAESLVDLAGMMRDFS